MRQQALQLLGDAVGLRLALGRDPRVEGDPHASPPVREARGRPRHWRLTAGPMPEDADRPGPIVVARPAGAEMPGVPATPASLPPAAGRSCGTGQTAEPA
jgi:hypothetical protein